MTTSGSLAGGGGADDGPASTSGRRTHRVTISDLARRLHISKASVSYALNGRAGVSDETRQRVLALAEELGFHPNSAAVALSASRTRTIGIVIARDPALISTEAFYMRTLVGIEQYLNEVDSSLLLRLTGEHGEDLDVLRRWSPAGPGRRVHPVRRARRRPADPDPQGARGAVCGGELERSRTTRSAG